MGGKGLHLRRRPLIACPEGRRRAASGRTASPLEPDEAYRLQYQARRDGHFAEEHYWARHRQGLEERGPRR